MNKKTSLLKPLVAAVLMATSVMTFNSCRKSAKDSLLSGEPASMVVPSGAIALSESSSGTLQVITAAGYGIAGTVDGTGTLTLNGN